MDNSGWVQLTYRRDERNVHVYNNSQRDFDTVYAVQLQPTN